MQHQLEKCWCGFRLSGTISDAIATGMWNMSALLANDLKLSGTLPQQRTSYQIVSNSRNCERITNPEECSVAAASLGMPSSLSTCAYQLFECLLYSFSFVRRLVGELSWLCLHRLLRLRGHQWRSGYPVNQHLCQDKHNYEQSTCVSELGWAISFLHTLHRGVRMDSWI